MVVADWSFEGGARMSPSFDTVVALSSLTKRRPRETTDPSPRRIAYDKADGLIPAIIPLSVQHLFIGCCKMTESPICRIGNVTELVEAGGTEEGRDGTDGKRLEC